MTEGGEHAESQEPKTWEPPAQSRTGNTHTMAKTGCNKGELLQLLKELFEVL